MFHFFFKESQIIKYSQSLLFEDKVKSSAKKANTFFCY